MKFFASLLLVVALALQVMAQTRVISGRVTDAAGTPMPNASVLLKGTSQGVTTDANGNYSITVPASASALIISSVGFPEQEISIGNRSSINVTLNRQDGNLDEVVVVAYGTVKRGSNTGSTAQVNAESIKNRPLTNVTSALDGSAPGIQLLSANGQPGSGQAIRLRGFGSINASNDPLYVVDGVPYNGPISAINMDDVESISALKDAASTALYGSRASNGIIVITTKKGKKNRNNLSFKAAVGFVDRAIPEYQRVGAEEYYPLLWDAYVNSLVYAATNPVQRADAVKIASGTLPRFTTGANRGLQNLNGRAYSDIYQLLGNNPFNVPNTQIVGVDGKLNPNARLKYADDLNWGDEIVRTGIRHEYNLGYSGGNDKSDFYGSFGYTKEQGFSIKSDLERFSGRLSLNTNPVKWFKTGLNVSTSLSKSNTANDGTSTAYINPFNFIRNIGPIYPVYRHNPSTGDFLLDGNGDRIWDFGNISDTTLGQLPRASGASAGRHILAETLLNEVSFKRTMLSARTYGTLVFAPWIDLTLNAGVDQNNYNLSDYTNRLVGDAAPTGRVTKTTDVTTALTINQLLNMRKAFGKHNTEFLVGHENYALKFSDISVPRSNQIFDGNTELINFAVAGNSTSYTDNHTIESYLSRLNYDYDGKYFVSSSFRRDGNSRFKKEFRWENFWSVGLAWRLDKELFIQEALPQVSALKLRTSYGKVGNDAGIGYYSYQALYSLGYNNGPDPGVIQTNLKNDTITWEASKNYDAAVEFGLFRNRINGTVEFYKRITDGLIFAVPLPLSNGGTPSGGYSLNKNIGSLYNQGIEVHLDGDIVRTNDWKWNVGINFSTLKNRITKMPDNQKEIISGTKKLSVGQSIYDYWLREWRGVDPADGAALYTALNTKAADVRINKTDTFTTSQNNAKYVYAGSAIPDYWGSVYTSLGFKSIEVVVNCTYQKGGLVYDAVYGGLMDNGSSYGSAQHIDALKAWKQAGDITGVPRMDNSKGGVFNAASTRWLTDASFFNIRNITLSYTFNPDLTRILNIGEGRFFVNIENAKLFSKRIGLNPQQSFTGVTSNAYMPARVTTVGFNLNF